MVNGIFKALLIEFRPMGSTPRADLDCECGLAIALPASAEVGTSEVACSCGRLHELELADDFWTRASVLHPEGSVPVTGFSSSLRQEPDARRYWFRQELRPRGVLIVHLVFSASTREAEVKAADQKAMRLNRVRSATEARRLWLASQTKPQESSQATRRVRRHLSPQDSGRQREPSAG